MSKIEKADLSSMTIEEMEIFFVGIDEKKFRAKQVFEWINKKAVDNFDEMTNLSKGLKSKLEEISSISQVRIEKKLESAKDDTIKYLFELKNHTIIESVFMKYSYGNSVCVSTQAGCKMGCVFCASTLGGVLRNLDPGEMCAQVTKIQADVGERIDNIVLMGSGEPLDNYEHTLKFIKLINSDEGLNIGQRHIVLSTCGIVDKMFDLAEENLQITLAVSLHAPNDEIRREIMPIARHNPLKEILRACRYYTERTKRRITFEYAMMAGINDDISLARELGQLLKGQLCHVNLINVNDVKERNIGAVSREKLDAFAALLQSTGIETTVRRKLGSDINAACGQLRKSYTILR